MPGIPTTYKRTSTGVRLEDIDASMVDSFVEHVLEDHRETPDQFANTGRKGRTPFHRTGELVRGFFFKRASSSAKRNGLIGTIRAPIDRFDNKFVRDRFVQLLERVWNVRGVGWSKGGL